MRLTTPHGFRLAVGALAAGTALLAGSVAPAAAAPPQARQWEALQSELDSLVVDAAAAGVTMSVSVTDLSGWYGTESLLAGQDERLKAASIIKLPLLALLMERVDAGTLSLDTAITIPAGSSNIVGGSGTLRLREFPLSITVAELMELMVQVSDNTATNVLIDLAGGFDTVNAYIAGLGFEDLHLGRKMIHPALPPEQENYITSSEVTELITMLWEGTILSRESSDYIIALMAGQLVNTKYGAVIPREHLANKTGELADVSHDSGIILVDGREIALTTTTAFGDIPRTDADVFVQRSAALVYELSLTPFIDVSSAHPFNAQISWLVGTRITTGYADGTFGPVNPVSRQAMAAFLYRVSTGAQKAPECAAAPFADIPVEDPFCGEIAWLAEQEIASGYEDGTFGPGLPVSRQAMAAFVQRSVDGDVPAADCTTAPFVDVPTSHPFCAEIAWMKAESLSTGYVGGVYEPTRLVSRQAMAAFLQRLDTRLAS